MTLHPCGRSFDETLLSGYLDGALTQSDEQRVRLHLEDCPSCRSLVEDLQTLRETTMTTPFKTPSDDQWDERPRGLASRMSFGFGWLLLILWIVGLAGFALWQLATGPDNLWEKLIPLGAISGVALLFLSVLIDRLKNLRHDRYRGVKK